MSSVEDFFKGIKAKDGLELTEIQKRIFCDNLRIALLKSKELEKIHYNTQVYNVIENGVTSRGSHSVGVATVAKVLAKKLAKNEGMSNSQQELSSILAECLGYMHDLGHTPFGHDGEGALGDEMERFSAPEDYKESRKRLFGDKYAKNTDSKKMCYEHNETSAVIAQQFLKSFAKTQNIEIDEYAMSYIITGILAHSTSRVHEEPDGIEQKAVRLADKVAYIPQDLADLLKQGVINIKDLKSEELELIGLNIVSNENDPTLSDKEKNELSQISEEKERLNYIKEINDTREELRQKLQKLNELSEVEKNDVVKILDVKISQMQSHIAEHCFIADENGKVVLNGFKEKFDKLVELAENSTIDKKQDASLIDKGVIALKELNMALVDYDKASQNKGGNISYNESLARLNNATDALKIFLVEEMKFEPTMATLWITKYKYQDSFISNRVHVHGERFAPNIDGTRFGQTLGQVNNRNENSWKMKVTFQYFLSNFDTLPKDFIEKYNETGYNNQQIVSAYIASFTNGGLDYLYEKLKEKRAVISREEAAQNIANNIRDDAGRSKYDSTEILNELIPKIKKELKKQGKKVSENDILEYLSETKSGYAIVNGKTILENQENKICIPYSAEQKSIDEVLSKVYNLSNYEPKLLSSTIEYTTEKISIETVKNFQELARLKKGQNLNNASTNQNIVQKGE